MPDIADKTITIEADNVADVALSPDQTRLYVSLTTGEIDVFDVATQEKVATWRVGTELGAVSVSQDGSYLLAADPRQPLLYQVSTNTGDIMQTYLGTGAAYRDIEIVNANMVVLTAPGFLKPAVTLNLDSGVTQPLDRSAYYSGSSILTRDNHLTLFGETGISNGPLALYDDRSHSIVATGDDYQSPFTGFNYGIQAVSEAAGKVFQFIFPQTINVYDLSLKYQHSVNIGQNVAGMAFDPTGKYVYAYLSDGGVAKYDAVTFNRVDLLSANPTGISSASQNYGNALLLANNGRHLVVTNYNMSYSDPGGSTQIIDLTGRSETLLGTQGNDNLIGGGGDDILMSIRGRDVVNGGDGDDTLVLASERASHSVLSYHNQTFLLSGADIVAATGIETVRFADGALAIGDVTRNLPLFDSLKYIASNPDLIAAFGADAGLGAAHFAISGFREGRTAGGFDFMSYLASNPDLIQAFGSDELAAETHFITYGFSEGRSATGFDPLLYAASNPDLARAFGTDADALLRHYVRFGANEGRATRSFDALEYAASNPDLARAFSTDTAALATHYIRAGIAEGRATTSFEALEYAASNPDLARAFGTNEAALTHHYVVAGLAEGRSIDSFDALAYAATNPDVARVFGSNESALERHYVAAGLAEGRAASGFDPVAYLLSNPDLGNASLQAEGALRHWIDAGIAEDRSGDSLFGREQASHVALIGGATAGTIDQARDRDWYGITLRAGETVTLDLAGDQRSDPRGFGLSDSLMTLYDSYGHVLAVDDNGGPGRDASLRYTATSDGLFYVEAAGANAFGFNDVGGYTLTVMSDFML